jgi:hypothetical protein
LVKAEWRGRDGFVELGEAFGKGFLFVFELGFLFMEVFQMSLQVSPFGEEFLFFLAGFVMEGFLPVVDFVELAGGPKGFLPFAFFAAKVEVGLVLHGNGQRQPDGGEWEAEGLLVEFFKLCSVGRLSVE